jgi:hypothetical protein
LPLGHTVSYQHTRQGVPKLSTFVNDHEKQRDWLRLAFYRDCHRASAVRVYGIGAGIKGTRPYISAVYVEEVGAGTVSLAAGGTKVAWSENPHLPFRLRLVKARSSSLAPASTWLASVARTPRPNITPSTNVASAPRVKYHLFMSISRYLLHALTVIEDGVRLC